MQGLSGCKFSKARWYYDMNLLVASQRTDIFTRMTSLNNEKYVNFSATSSVTNHLASKAEHY